MRIFYTKLISEVSVLFVFLIDHEQLNSISKSFNTWCIRESNSNNNN